MPPTEKKFVKYAFDEANNKQRQQRRPSRDNFKQRDNNQQNRGRRQVSYTEKSSSRQNVAKQMINTFVPINKPSAKVQQLMKNFPKYFNLVPKEPQPYNPESLNGYLAMMGKKMMDRQVRTFVHIDPQNQTDPEWDSDSDLEGGIESKKIDQNIIQKAIQRLGTIKQLRNADLKRHEKQFLEDHFRQKHQQLVQKQKQEEQNKQKNPNSKSSIEQDQNAKLENDWTEYQEKQVEDFINMGFIQKIQQDQNDFADADDDFSVQDEKSQSSHSEKSSEGDDDIFGDQGPTTIVKKKQVGQQNSQQKPISLGTVVINSHVFSRIAQAVGIPPGACIWIIRNNKNLRYKVSTQFMDQMYRLNNFCQSLPYVSLNHSQFVHNNDVQKEKGLQIFKKFNARKHQQNNHHGQNTHKIGNGNRNFDNNKRKFQYKPNTQNIQKTHLNKK